MRDTVATAEASTLDGGGAERAGHAQGDGGALRVCVGVLGTLFAVEMVTGCLLMLYYSPSVQTAWGSVWYIETQVEAGSVVRGIHRLASDALIVVSGVSVFAAVAVGAVRWRHRWVWCALVGVVLAVMALAITGRTLPWDQHAYWGTVVRTNLAGRAPIVGEWIRATILGGSEPGQLTLTRFHAAHVLLLPGVMAVMVWWIRVRGLRGGFRASWSDREGTTSVASDPPRSPLGKGGREEAAGLDPRAAARRWVAARRRAVATGSAVLNSCVVALLVVSAWGLSDRPAWTTLAAPADAQSVDYPARPEWFNLFLYQWLKGFHGPAAEVIGLIVIPGVIFAMIIALPWVTARASARVARTAAWVFCGGMGLAIVVLTFEAVRADYRGELSRVHYIQGQLRGGAAISEFHPDDLRSYEFQMQWVRARSEARRACELAANGIPVSGPLELLRNDPQTQGPRLFAEHCSACHRFAGHDGLGGVPSSPATSSDLAGVGSSQWIRDLLNDPMSDSHFGLMKTPDGAPAHTRMAKWIAEQNDEADSDSLREALAADFNAVAAYLETESRRRDVVDDCTTEFVERGRRVFFDRCNECHSYNGERTGTLHGPEMKGYASVEWLERFIADAGGDAFYRRQGKEPARMPAFEDRLSAAERKLLAVWLHDSN